MYTSSRLHRTLGATGLGYLRQIPLRQAVGSILTFAVPEVVVLPSPVRKAGPLNPTLSWRFYLVKSSSLDGGTLSERSEPDTAVVNLCATACVAVLMRLYLFFTKRFLGGRCRSTLLCA